MSRRLLALGVLAVGLVLPANALADIGFNKDALKANVQASIQTATVVQTGVATSGPATANGGAATGGAGTGGAGGYVNTGNDGTSQSQSATSSTGAATSGGIDGGDTASVGNDGGSISNSNSTDVDVDSRAIAMEMNVLGFDPYFSADAALDGKVKIIRDFDQFLAQLDVITFHVPGGEGTKHLINRERLFGGKCKPNLLVINDARGEVVDEFALADALGHAGTDTGQRFELRSSGGVDVDDLRRRRRARLLHGLAGRVWRRWHRQGQEQGKQRTGHGTPPRVA